MGWCSGTELFDRVIECMSEVADDHINWEGAVEEVVTAFQDHDWDCESDSDYWESEVRPAMKRMGQLNDQD